MHLPVVGEIGAGQATLLALSPGTAVQDHDRRSGAARAPTRSCPTSGPTAASRRS